MADAAETIRSLDKRIDANRRVLQNRAGLLACRSLEDVQAAWNAHPELYAVECDLFRQRGQAQLQRDMLQAERARRDAHRAVRTLPKCKACGGSGLAKAVA